MWQLLLLMVSLPLARQDEGPPGLDALRGAYEAATTAAERIEALEALARADSPGAPSPAIAEAVAIALDEEDYGVRVRAVELLAGLHEEVAAAALCRAAATHVRETEEVRQYLERFAAEQQAKAIEWGELSASEASRAWVNAYNEMERYLEGKQGLIEVRRALVGSLADLRFDASVDALTLLLGEELGERADATVDALIALGTAGAIEPVVARFALLERVLSDGERELKKLRRARPGRRPNNRWSKEGWEAWEQERVQRQISALEKQSEELTSWAGDLAARLGHFAEARQLPQVPSNADADNWRSWMRRSRQVLPASLGAVEAGER